MWAIQIKFDFDLFVMISLDKKQYQQQKCNISEPDKMRSNKYTYKWKQNNCKYMDKTLNSSLIAGELDGEIKTHIDRHTHTHRKSGMSKSLY